MFTITGKTGSGILSSTYNVKFNIRKTIVGSQSSVFLQLSYKYDDSNETNAFISYNDVIELDKALDELIKQREADSLGEASYLENKFKTEDYLQLGYYLQKRVKKEGVLEETYWYIDLDSRYRRSTAFFSTPENLSNGFKKAIQKLNELK